MGSIGKAPRKAQPRGNAVLRVLADEFRLLHRQLSNLNPAFSFVSFRIEIPTQTSPAGLNPESLADYSRDYRCWSIPFEAHDGYRIRTHFYGNPQTSKQSNRKSVIREYQKLKPKLHLCGKGLLDVMALGLFPYPAFCSNDANFGSSLVPFWVSCLPDLIRTQRETKDLKAREIATTEYYGPGKLPNGEDAILFTHVQSDCLWDRCKYVSYSILYDVLAASIEASSKISQRIAAVRDLNKVLNKEIPSGSRKGRLNKLDSKAKKTVFLSLVVAHPTLLDTPVELAERLGVSESTARRWIRGLKEKYRNKK